LKVLQAADHSGIVPHETAYWRVRRDTPANQRRLWGAAESDKITSNDQEDR
jgi:hypothetical protein